MDNDDLDEDIERLKIVLQDEEDEEAGSDGELRVLDNNDEEYQSNASRPSTSSDITASSLPTTSMCTDADDAAIRFDPHTITAETCLAINRAYQEVLLDTLRQIEMTLFDNRDRQKQLEESMDDKSRKSEKPSKEGNSGKDNRLLPYFRDKDGHLPPPNPDVLVKAQMEEDKQHVKPKLGWTKAQRKMLINAIKIEALEHMIRPLLSKQEVEMEKLRRCKNQEEIDATKARIEQIQNDIKLKQETPAEELLKNVETDKIDFLKIAAVTFENKYDSTECESIWRNVLHSEINREKWTPEEEEKLAELVEKHQMRNWKQIAQELGTHRTPFQCLQHHQHKSAIYDQSEWTQEEDELLKEVVETCTYGTGRVQWHQVAYYIDRRSATQCQSRWLIIDPNRNIGRWTKEEDMQLLAAVQAHIGDIRDWMKIQEHVPTRNASQCRERYLNGFNETMLHRPWLYDEDKKLLTLVQQFGNQWSRVAEHFVGRNDNSCLLRFKRLMKWQQLMEQFKLQHRDVQKQLLHPAFDFGPGGEIIQKTGLVRRNVMRGRPKGIPLRKKSEIDKLKENAKNLLDPSITGEDEEEEEETKHVPLLAVKQEPVDPDVQGMEEGGVVKTEEETDEKGEKKSLQNSLDAFLSTYNIAMSDYHKMFLDECSGGMVVPRPPPVKKYLSKRQNHLWKGVNNLADVVIAQIDKYVSSLSDASMMNANLYDQIANNIRGATDEQKKNMITAMFKGQNPCHLSVKTLLHISRTLKERGKLPKGKSKVLEPWELEGSDNDEAKSSSSSESDVMEISDEEQEKERKPKKPRTEKQQEWAKKLGQHNKEHRTLVAHIKSIIQSKMSTLPPHSAQGRRKKCTMYPKAILQRYRGLEEERRLNRKSLVLLMKSLDLDAKKAYFKARKSKRRLSAMAFLKSAEKNSLQKAKTRRQKQNINEAAKARSSLSSEISEVADYILDIREDLNIKEDEFDPEEKVSDILDNDEAAGDDAAAVAQAVKSTDQPSKETEGYNKNLPYIPPNQTTLQGMRTLLLEHRCLIDQSDNYFNPEQLKNKLYELKKKGPNPLMGVLNAIGKTESLERRAGRLPSKAKLPREVCDQKMQEIRNTRAYKQLKARFQAVFSWPALLATIPPPRGVPLPQSLQDICDTPKTGYVRVIKSPASTEKSDVMTQNADITPQNDDVTTQNDDVTSQNADIIIENDDVTAQNDELDEDLPEEEAVERLVDKIMEQYEQERSKRKRKLQPVLRRRNFVSEKRKQSYIEKERTKILKKLGLYEKMQEFKRRRLEEQQETQSPSTSGTSTSGTPATAGSGLLDTSAFDAGEILTATPLVTGEAVETSMPLASGDPSAGPLVPEEAMETGVQSTELPNTNTDKSTSKPVSSRPAMISSESCQANFDSDDEDPAESEEIVPKKRGRGRPKGSKSKVYSGPLREKSERAVESSVNVKLDEDFVSPKPKKKRDSSNRGAQYTLVRELVPKLSNITSKISDLPILNEPLPEKPVKTPKPPKPVKPKPQLQKVMRNKLKRDPHSIKYDYDEVKKKPKIVKTTHKATKIWKKLREEATQRAKEMRDTPVCDIKVEQDELMNSYSVDQSTNDEKEVACNKKKTIITSRMKQKLTQNSNSCTVSNGLPNSTDLSTVSVHETSKLASQGAGLSTVNISQSNSFTTVSESETNNLSTENVSKTSSLSTVRDSQTQDGSNSKISSTDSVLNMASTGSKPVMIAVPVFIGGVQQIACIPFYPDEEGKITLPSGKKIDTRATPQGLQDTVSLPLFNYADNVVQPQPGSVPQSGTSQPGTIPQSGTSQPGTIPQSGTAQQFTGF